MVKVMENLQIYRSTSNLFSGKDSIVTVRDLLKWAGRINQAQQGLSMSQIALEGFLVLGERARDVKDKEFIRKAIEKVFSTKIEPALFYQQYYSEYLAGIFDQVPSELNIPKLIASK